MANTNLVISRKPSPDGGYDFEVHFYEDDKMIRMSQLESSDVQCFCDALQATKDFLEKLIL